MQVGRTGQDRWPAPSQAKPGRAADRPWGPAARQARVPADRARRAPRPRPPTQEPGRAVEPWLPAPWSPGAPRAAPSAWSGASRGRAVAPTVRWGWGRRGVRGGIPSTPVRRPEGTYRSRHPATAHPAYPVHQARPPEATDAMRSGVAVPTPRSARVAPSAGTSEPRRPARAPRHPPVACRAGARHGAGPAAHPPSRPCPSAPAPPRTRSTRPRRPGSRRHSRSVRRGPSRRRGGPWRGHAGGGGPERPPGPPGPAPRPPVSRPGSSPRRAPPAPGPRSVPSRSRHRPRTRPPKRSAPASDRG